MDPMYVAAWEATWATARIVQVLFFFFLSLFSLLCLFAFYVRAAPLALDIIAGQFYIHFYSSELLQPDLAQLF